MIGIFSEKKESRPIIDPINRASAFPCLPGSSVVQGTYRYQSHQEPWTELRMRIQDRTEQGALRVSQDPRAAQPRGLERGQVPGVPVVQGRGLALKKRPKRKRKAVRHREERFIATAPNQAWSTDFVADQLQDGTRFRALTMLDVYTREAVAIEVRQSLKGDDVVRTLNRMKQERGVPKVLFCDNGSEFTSQAMDLWAYQNGMKIDFSRPGKPTDNAFVESFNADLPKRMPERSLVHEPKGGKAADRSLEAGI